MKFKIVILSYDHFEIVPQDSTEHISYYMHSNLTFEDAKAKVIDVLEDKKGYIDKQIERIGNLTREDYI